MDSLGADFLGIEFEKYLVEHFVYDSWQFIINTSKSINIAEYCYQLIVKLTDQMSLEHREWKNELYQNAIEEIKEGEIARIELNENNLPKYNLNLFGIDVSYPFLIDKTLKDFFQYVRNSFDSMAQIANSALLANRCKSIDSVDFDRIKTVLNQQTYSLEFGDTQKWYNDTYDSDEFKYIVAFNNRIKHTCDVYIQLSTDLFNDNNNEFKIGSFHKWGNHPEKDIVSFTKHILKFTAERFKQYLLIIKNEIAKDVYNNGRIHKIHCYQQKMKNDPNSSFSVMYVKVDSSIDELPETLYILLLSNSGNEVRARNCEFNTILVRDKDKHYIGKFVRETTGTMGDNLLRYNKYNKVQCDGMLAFFEEMSKDNGFYKWNPFFDIEVISDDKEFCLRCQSPI